MLTTTTTAISKHKQIMAIDRDAGWKEAAKPSWNEPRCTDSNCSTTRQQRALFPRGRSHCDDLPLADRALISAAAAAADTVPPASSSLPIHPLLFLSSFHSWLNITAEATVQYLLDPWPDPTRSTFQASSLPRHGPWANDGELLLFHYGSARRSKDEMSHEGNLNKELLSSNATVRQVNNEAYRAIAHW